MKISNKTKLFGMILLGLVLVFCIAIDINSIISSINDHNTALTFLATMALSMCAVSLVGSIAAIKDLYKKINIEDE